MRRGMCLLLVVLVAACGTATPPTEPVPDAAGPTAAPAAQPPPPPAEPVPDAAGLAEPGPYGVGVTLVPVTDEARGGRSVTFKAWYPAVTEGESTVTEAPADRRGAPYPVVVGSTDMYELVGKHVASHGYVVMASVGNVAGWGSGTLDLVLDRVLALDHLASIGEGPLEGLADTNRAGVVDYSYGTVPALMLAGARIDPAYYREACGSAGDEPPFDPALLSWSWGMLKRYYCQGAAENWEAFSGHATDLGVATDSGLWASMADDRIKAVVAGGPEGRWLFGEEGLAAAAVPVLFFAGSADDINVYDFETRFLFDHLGSSAGLVTFVGADHMLVYDSAAREQIERLATAFLGLHVKGDERYAEYLSPEFVETVAPALAPSTGYQTLLWGFADR